MSEPYLIRFDWLYRLPHFMQYDVEFYIFNFLSFIKSLFINVYFRKYLLNYQDSSLVTKPGLDFQIKK